MCDFLSILRCPADARAQVSGGTVRGQVRFYQTAKGVLVWAQIEGLPAPEGIYAFHIHEGTDCAAPGGHYNPGGLQHPHHAGDMPPLFSANGRAFLLFLTDRFAVRQVLGRTVIIHTGPDDFTTQPSGNPGKIMACGVIKK